MLSGKELVTGRCVEAAGDLVSTALQVYHGTGAQVYRYAAVKLCQYGCVHLNSVTTGMMLHRCIGMHV